jgi:hypothetical protein
MLVTADWTLRFAVAAFDSWEGMQPALRDLSGTGSPQRSFNYLGLQRVLTGADGPLPIEPLPFPGNRELISCSSGPVATRLAARLRTGAVTLQAALSRWLIPRHAARLQEAVEGGCIVLWVQILDVESERRAYQSLLAKTSSPVGVHDLIGD